MEINNKHKLLLILIISVWRDGKDRNGFPWYND